ncbi:hypothetical protein F4810DRAFT_659068 [Camillea tinctor]|nr:hypothetical protein F4810DRAFT_659068 [Camillea tinctor]
MLMVLVQSFKRPVFLAPRAVFLIVLRAWSPEAFVFQFRPCLRHGSVLMLGFTSAPRVSQGSRSMIMAFYCFLFRERISLYPFQPADSDGAWRVRRTIPGRSPVGIPWKGQATVCTASKPKYILSIVAIDMIFHVTREHVLGL